MFCWLLPPSHSEEGTSDAPCANRHCFPTPRGRRPPARGMCCSPGAVVLLVCPQLWDTLSVWPPLPRALPFMGRRKQVWEAWCRTGTMGQVGTLSPCPGLGKKVGTGTTLATGPEAEPRTGSGLLCSNTSWFGVFLQMNIKVFVWSPLVVQDWVSHWHQPAGWRESVPGSAALPGAGHGRGHKGTAICPLSSTEAFTGTSQSKGYPYPAVLIPWCMRDLQMPKIGLAPLASGPFGFWPLWLEALHGPAAPRCHKAPCGYPKDTAACHHSLTPLPVTRW